MIHLNLNLTQSYKKSSIFLTHTQTAPVTNYLDLRPAPINIFFPRVFAEGKKAVCKQKGWSEAEEKGYSESRRAR